jgi:hypothetical protein
MKSQQVWPLNRSLTFDILKRPKMGAIDDSWFISLSNETEEAFFSLSSDGVASLYGAIVHRLCLRHIIGSLEMRKAGAFAALTAKSGSFQLVDLRIERKSLFRGGCAFVLKTGKKQEIPLVHFEVSPIIQKHPFTSEIGRSRYRRGRSPKRILHGTANCALSF